MVEGLQEDLCGCWMQYWRECPKLYEPKKYLGAKLLPYFQRHFGEPAWRRSPANHSGLCALGFEPNADHKDRLAAIEKGHEVLHFCINCVGSVCWLLLLRGLQQRTNVLQCSG
jgi:hypothetical protein